MGRTLPTPWTLDMTSLTRHPMLQRVNVSTLIPTFLPSQSLQPATNPATDRFARRVCRSAESAGLHIYMLLLSTSRVLAESTQPTRRPRVKTSQVSKSKDLE